MSEEKKEKLSFNEYQKHAYNLISEDGKKDMLTKIGRASCRERV